MIHSLSGYSLQISVPPAYGKSVLTACPDQIVGYIIYDGTRFTSVYSKNSFGLRRDVDPNKSLQKRVTINYAAYNNGNNELIVIILESPHIKEFSNILGAPGPAMGSAGNRFNSQCIKVFNNNLQTLQTALGLTSTSSQRRYSVCFVNAIQYQCSLGYKPIKTELRDTIFEGLWNHYPDSFKDDLIERLNILKPRLIINACTKNLKVSCCNGAAITNGLSGFQYSFLTASKHIVAWDKNTIII